MDRATGSRLPCLNLVMYLIPTRITCPLKKNTEKIQTIWRGGEESVFELITYYQDTLCCMYGIYYFIYIIICGAKTKLL